MKYEPAEFVERARQVLSDTWQQVRSDAQKADRVAPLAGEPSLVSAIKSCLTSSTKTYHYVLPTQLLAKVIEPSLDCHSLQASFDSPGAFDARTLAHGVIVPFDQENYRVLGGSPEPYVNNPVRIPGITEAYREQQKNKADWDNLVQILDLVEKTQDPQFTQRLFAQTLLEIYDLLSNIVVVYPTPNRISLSQIQLLLANYLTDASGGDRIEALTSALFQIIGEEFHIFDRVERAKVNASDTSSGMLADIECWRDGRIALLVEVKDRSLTLTQLDLKLENARSQHIAELLFIAQQRDDPVEKEQIEQRIANEFTSGQNVYVSSFDDFAWAILILLGETGRIRFTDRIGEELERVSSSIEHRRAWANLLKTI